MSSIPSATPPPSISSKPKIVVKPTLEAASGKKQLFYYDDDKPETVTKALQDTFHRTQFFTNKFKIPPEDKTSVMVDFIYLLQAHKKYIQGAAEQVMRAFLEINDNDYNALVSMAQHRYPNWDALFDKIFTQSIKNFAKVLANKEIGNKRKDNPEKVLNNMLCDAIQKLHFAGSLFDIIKNDGIQRFLFTFEGFNLAGIRLFNLQLRRQFSCKKANFNGAELYGLNLDKTSIKGASFEGAKLYLETQSQQDPTEEKSDPQDTKPLLSRPENAVQQHPHQILFGAENPYPVATFMNLSGTDDSNFTGAIMNHIQIVSCNFANNTMVNIQAQGAQISGTRFENVDLTAAKFEGANLKNVSFIDCALKDCIFSKTTITNCEINFHAGFSGVSFADATIKNTVFSGDLSQIDFQGATFENINLENCTFSIKNLMEIDFSGVLKLIDTSSISFPKEPKKPEDKFSPQLVDRAYTIEEIDLIFRKENGKRNIIDFLDCLTQNTLLTPEENYQIQNPTHRRVETEISIKLKKKFSSFKKDFLINFFLHLKKQHFEKESFNKEILAYKGLILSIFLNHHKECLADPVSKQVLYTYILHPFMLKLEHGKNLSLEISEEKEEEKTPLKAPTQQKLEMTTFSQAPPKKNVSKEELNNFYSEFLSPYILKDGISKPFYFLFNNFINKFIYYCIEENCLHGAVKTLIDNYFECIPNTKELDLKKSFLEKWKIKKPDLFLFASSDFMQIVFLTKEAFKECVIKADSVAISSLLKWDVYTATEEPSGAIIWEETKGYKKHDLKKSIPILNQIWP